MIKISQRGLFASGLLACSVACSGQQIAEVHSATPLPARAAATRAEGMNLPPAPSALVRPLILTANTPVSQVRSETRTGALALTLDDAIATALKGNTALALRMQQERIVRGQTLSVGNALLPDIAFKAYTQAQEINLAANGFKRQTLKAFPGFNPATFSTIVKVNSTDAEVTVSQALFNVPAYFIYRAAQKAGEAANWETLSTRGSVVIQTGALYLQTLADQAQVVNATALVRQDEFVFKNASARLQAGVGIRLDVLRAQVQLQVEQQELVRASNAVAKDKIQLNRAMGRPAGQELSLVDNVPFADFEALSVGDALQIAYVKRKDLRGLEAQLEVANKARLAVKYERLPSLGVGGFYGVLGQTTGLYHGVFAAEGKLSIPVFEEGTLRGQREVAESQVMALQHQIVARRVDIEADIRSAMLDVDSSRQLVVVSRSNVALATQALSDATDRFTAGVDDDLPLNRAQAALAGAQNQQIQSEFRYNYAKLLLARNTGVVESEYKRYLGH